MVGVELNFESNRLPVCPALKAAQQDKQPGKLYQSNAHGPFQRKCQGRIVQLRSQCQCLNPLQKRSIQKATEVLL